MRIKRRLGRVLFLKAELQEATMGVRKGQQRKQSHCKQRNSSSPWLSFKGQKFMYLFCDFTDGGQLVWTPLMEAVHFSPYFMFEFICHKTELILLLCFRTFKGRIRSPQVSPSSPISLRCKISDPEAAKEMQLDIKLNMQSSNYKRKDAAHLTPVGGPGILIAWLYTVGL